MFELTALRQAAELIGRHVPPTPQYSWPLLAQRLGCEVWVEHENHTPASAFKIRGGLLYVDELLRREPGLLGMISATRGNHGISLAMAAQRSGIPLKVLVPEGNSTEKNAAMRACGAEVIEYGRDFDSARQHASELAAQSGWHFVPALHPDLIRGVATYALELFEAAPPLRRVYVPIGMGSGICGLIRTRDLLGLATEIIGVVSSAADAYAQSFEQGRIVCTETAETFADGMACRMPAAEALEIINQGATRIVRVDDGEIRQAIVALHEDTHNTAEGAGAAALAAAIQEQERNRGERIAVVLSGANIDRKLLAKILAG